MAVAYDGGVIIGADSRTSTGCVHIKHGVQGVVTSAPSVEAFATGIKKFDRRNRPLIA